MKRTQSDGTQKSGLTEPILRECLFITGLAFESASGSIRLIGWVELPDLGGETTERRIVSRLAMTTETARHVLTLLSSILEEDE